MHNDAALVIHRVNRFVSERLEPALHRRRSPLQVTLWQAPGEPVPFAEAVSQEFTPFTLGTPWGYPWSTNWFHITGQVPTEWEADQDLPVEVVVDLGFTRSQPGFQAEGTAWTPDGVIIKGIEPRNDHVPVTAGPGGLIDFYVEASSNPSFDADWRTPTPLGDRATAGTDPIYTLRAVDVAQRDLVVWELVQDVAALSGLMHALGAELPRRHEILRGLEDLLDTLDPHDIAGTAATGRAAIAPLLAAPAHASAHRLHAVGHAHIDSAWLWPTRETVRKCARTFSNVLDLMDEDPDFTFVCSSAQQYAWVQEHYPELFERIRARVAEGRFVPVGGMWVESDTNLPGGEAMVRQFVAGTGYFLSEFGIEAPEVWLPDSFGYSGALPQIVREAGKEFFLTQKISWNDTNRMPHHTFDWEGIDGTRVFTHFPPVDTYNSVLSGEELARAQRQYAEKGRANTSLVPFGYGDGGGGPTREMVAAAHRTADLEGSPRVELSTSTDFFETARTEYSNPPVWSGEMYLEYHRGTYTSQHRTKAGNRRSEHLLREAELWAATATVRTGSPYPREELERIWRLVLLQQFHDILPGSSIAWVHREAERNYLAVAAELEELIMDSLGTLAGNGNESYVVNAGPLPVGSVPAMGAAIAEPTIGGVSVTPAADGWLLESDRLRVRVDADGLIRSVLDLAADREVLDTNRTSGLLQVHRDTPNQWDAWDIDRHYRHVVTDLTEADEITVIEDGSEAGLEIRRSVGSSTIVERLTLSPGRAAVDLDFTVDWHERQKLLKLAFAVDVHADRATSEIQFGHLHRPTHANTSWDSARFETVAHRWVHVAEPGYGVALANDCTYGYDITRDTRDAGGTTTTIRASLLRAPLFPDPDADQGEHRLRFSLAVGAEIADAVAAGYRLNLPLRTVTGAEPIRPLVHVDNPAVLVEAVKLAEDGSGDVVVRLYEAHGGRARAIVTADFDHAAVIRTDLLERPVDSSVTPEDQAAAAVLALRPFQLVTLRYRRP
ncbi:MAG: alpha-mannosidase [Propionibacteriaceae bacterium]